MANAFDPRTNSWIVDTASGTAVTTETVFVKQVRYTIPAAGLPSQAVIQNTESPAKTILDLRPQASETYMETQVEQRWHGGFAVPTLDAGVLYIDLY